MVIFPVHPDGTSTDSSNRPAPVVAIIPARYRSSRLPGKPLALIGGRPMIEHVYRRAAAAPSVDRVIVATDDERVVRAVEAFGGQPWMTDAAHETGTDRLAEVARTLDCTLVVNIQGDEPLIEPGMIEDAITPFSTDRHLTMTTLRRRCETSAEVNDPNVVKVVVDQHGDALFFSRAPLPYRRDDAGPPTCRYRHVGLYVYRRDFLLRFARLTPTPLERSEALEQLRVLEHGYRIRTVETTCDSIGVDTPEDLERVRRVAAAGIRV